MYIYENKQRELINKKNINKERVLKINSKFQPRAYRNVVRVPEIRLTGKWLKNSGFEEGAQIKVEVRQKRIVITLLEEEEK